MILHDLARKRTITQRYAKGPLINILCLDSVPRCLAPSCSVLQIEPAPEPAPDFGSHNKLLRGPPRTNPWRTGGERTGPIRLRGQIMLILEIRRSLLGRTSDELVFQRLKTHAAQELIAPGFS